MNHLAAILLLGACFPVVSLAQGVDSVHHTAPVANGVGTAGAAVLQIRPVDGQIQVDGDLNDAGWVSASRTSNLTEFSPREGVAPPAATDVYVAYDTETLYLAFVAHGDPKDLRASLRERDQVSGDDLVGVVIDPFGEDVQGYMILVNPMGVQNDLLVTANNQDIKHDLVFSSAAKITAEGYQVEIAIPFRSMRFPRRKLQDWKVNFLRTMPRSSRHQIAWAPISRNNPCFLCQSGRLVGLEGIRSGGALELLPSIIGSRGGASRMTGGERSFGYEDPTAELGVSAKYSFRTGLALEGAINPDFSQVESDAAQVDVNTTFALFFPERRPFFQEGSDLFATRLNVLYTRSINDPQVATKLTGRTEHLNVGYIGARDEHTPFIVPFEEHSALLQAGRSISNVLRVRRNLHQDSYIGALVTDRRLEEGGSGTTGGLDAALRFGGVYRLEAQLVGSYTSEPADSALTRSIGNFRFGYGSDSHTSAFDGEDYAGRAVYLGLSRTARFWNFIVTYDEATPAYRADNGFQTQNDFRTTSLWTGFTLYPGKNSIADKIVPGVTMGSRWNFAGDRKGQWLSPTLTLTLKRQTTVALNAHFNEERFGGTDFTGLRNYSVSLNSNFSDPVSVGFFASRSRSIARNLTTPEVGPGRFIQGYATVKLLQQLVVEPSYIFADLKRESTGDEVYSGYIARVLTNYQATRELSLRVVTQYDDFSRRLAVEPLAMYRLNPFTLFYAGSTQAYQRFDEADDLQAARRQYFVKVQYLFRR